MGNCTSVTLTEENILNRELMTASSSVSVVGSVFILVYFIRFSLLRQYPLVLLLYISLADFIMILGFLMQCIPTLLDAESDIDCLEMFIATVMAGAGTFASHVWVTVYATQCLLTLGVFSSIASYFSDHRVWLLVHMCVWPASFALGYVHTKDLTNTLLFDTMKNNISSWLLLGLPLFTFWTLNVCLFLMICLTLVIRRKDADISAEGRKTVDAVYSRLLLFMVAYILCWLPFFVGLAMHFASDQSPAWIRHMWSLTLPLQGAINAVVLGNSQLLRSMVKSDLSFFRLSTRTTHHSSVLADVETFAYDEFSSQSDYDDSGKLSSLTYIDMGRLSSPSRFGGKTEPNNS